MLTSFRSSTYVIGSSVNLGSFGVTRDSFKPKWVTSRTKWLTFNTFLSHFVREVTQFGSNDSLRVFCAQARLVRVEIFLYSETRPENVYFLDYNAGPDHWWRTRILSPVCTKIHPSHLGSHRLKRHFQLHQSFIPYPCYEADHNTHKCASACWTKSSSKNATCTEYMVLTLCNKVYLCYVTHFNMHELETIVFCHSGSNPGHFRRQTTPSAMANYCLVCFLSVKLL